LELLAQLAKFYVWNSARKHLIKDKFYFFSVE